MAHSFGGWPYNAVRIEVQALESDALLDPLGATESRGGWVDGSQTIQRLIRAVFFDDLIVTHVPVLLGEWRSVIGPDPADVPLAHVATEAFADGLVQTRYRFGHLLGGAFVR